MRAPFIIASIVCSLALSAHAHPTKPSKKNVSSRSMGVSIRVDGYGWGSAKREEIESVLYSVADELLSRIPKRLTTPIVVTHTESNPVALYDKGPGGEYQVHLHARDRRWHLYAYEFAHELCHIMSNYEENLGADTSKYNQWFEEAMCETASLYTLKGLASTWEASPPPPDWEAHADRVREFADMLIKEGHRQLPPHAPLSAWLRENEAKLRANPYLRDKNEVLANLLLPLFEANPENWDALCYLNLDPADARSSLHRYLHNWYDNAPAEHRAFLASVLDLLGVKDVVPVDSTLAASTPEPSAVSASESLQPGQAGRRQP